jgi:hypothetical protein
MQEIKRETQEIQNEITEIEANDNLSEGAKEEKKKSLKDRLQVLNFPCCIFPIEEGTE